MAVRINPKTKRIPSEVVQGPGSYVVIEMPSFADLVAVLETKSEITTGALENGNDLGLLNLAGLSMELVAMMVKEWDWVDDQGNLLPVDRETITGRLTLTEQTFLINESGIQELLSQKK